MNYHLLPNAVQRWLSAAGYWLCWGFYWLGIIAMTIGMGLVILGLGAGCLRPHLTPSAIGVCVIGLSVAVCGLVLWDIAGGYLNDYERRKDR